MNILEKQSQSGGRPLGQPPGQPMDGELDPETNPAYVQAKELMLSKLYEEGAADQIAQAMSAAPDLVQGVVDQIMAMLDAMEAATDGAVPDELVMSFVIEVVSEFIEIAQAAKLPIGSTEIAAIIRDVLANVVDNLGGDSSAIREEMAKIDPSEIAATLDSEED